MKKFVFTILCFMLFLISLFSVSFASEETVYANDFVNIRTEPDISSEIITVLQKGSSITRIGETDNGWSKVIFEGEERYIFSEYLSYLSEQENPTFVEEVTEIPEESETEDNSTPRFMVISYELSGGSLFPEESAILKINFRNYSKTKELFNIKLSISDPAGEIVTVGMPTKYINTVSADGSLTWEVELNAVYTASIGQHDLYVTAEYEDKNFNSYSSSDTVRIDVRQSVKLSYSGAILPKKVIQGDTQTVTLELMNTGKSMIYNCMLDFEVEKMKAGGSVFVGNIAPASSMQGSANLRVDSDVTGAVKGKITISYEDDYGKTYQEIIDVSTVIEKKIEAADVENSEKEEKSNSLWWLFILIGLVAGSLIGFGIPWLIKDKKQREEDNLRL